MNLINFNTQTIIIFFVFLFLWSVFLYFIYKNWKNRISIIILFLSFLLLIIWIFWFRWSLQKNIETQNSWNTLFAIDVSKSMNVADFEYGNSNYSRLESTKYLINDILDKNVNDNYWLVIFAWESLEILPFTHDTGLYKTILSWVDDKNLTKAWTDLNSVFDSILSFFRDDETIWTVVVFSDGWDDLNIDLLKEKVKKIKEKKLWIIVVWVWSTQWGYVPDWKDMFWNIIYKNYNWEKVVSKLNEKDLKSLSSEYGFEYIRFENIDDIKKIENLITKNTFKTLSTNNVDNREDLTRKLVLISFILFLMFLWVEYFEQKKK